MAKRNKPIVKQRKPGTQHERRLRAGYWPHADYARGREEWVLLVPRLLAGDDRTFSMEDAKAAGADGRVGDPVWRGELCRWTVHRGGRMFSVYGRLYRIHENRPGVYVSSALEAGEVFHVFTAERKCSNGSTCPLADYFCEDIDFTVQNHRPGRCPAGVPGPGVWKYVKRVTVASA